jgi:hypothetical protein
LTEGVGIEYIKYLDWFSHLLAMRAGGYEVVYKR